MGEGHDGNGSGAPGAGGAQNFSMLGQLLALLLSEHAGVNIAENKQGLEELEKFTRQMVEKRETPEQPAGH
jgi:hypothetical protein